MAWCRRRLARRLWSILGVGWFLALALGIDAQDYTLDWYSIDGGGGASTGGVYAINGTIGQPDAGQLSGEAYTLTGGFWSMLAAIQTPGAPTLSIVMTNGMVRVFWLQPAPDWILEQTSTLTGAPAPWTEIAPPYPSDAPYFYYTVTPVNGQTYFRLHKP